MPAPSSNEPREGVEPPARGAAGTLSSTRVGERQGWSPDPFGRFEERYFSGGAPTWLVRNGRKESRDDPAGFGPVPPDSTAGEPDSASDPDDPREHFEPRLYARRAHPRLGPLVLFVAALVPPAAFVLLAPNRSTRMFVLGCYATLTVAVSILLIMARSPRMAPNVGDSVDASARSFVP